MNESALSMIENGRRRINGTTSAINEAWSVYFALRWKAMSPLYVPSASSYLLLATTKGKSQKQMYQRPAIA